MANRRGKLSSVFAQLLEGGGLMIRNPGIVHCFWACADFCLFKQASAQCKQLGKTTQDALPGIIL